MNFLRGIISIGIIIACVLNWIDIEVEIMMFSLSGLTWTSSTILLYVSVFTAGYAFYNSYNDSNRNAWIYLISGLYGIGVTIYIYLSIFGLFDFIHTNIPFEQTDQPIYNFGFGIYLTGLLSFLLFLTGFDKSDHKANVTSPDQQHTISNEQINVQIKEQEKHNKPSLKEWKKVNPGKTINDYYSKYK